MRLYSQWHVCFRPGEEYLLKMTWEDFIKFCTPELKSEDFIEQITEYGYFAEQFPSCYSSKLFASQIDKLLPFTQNIKNQKNKQKTSSITSPTTLSVRKDDISRRIISLPNPKAFLRLSKLMQENWEEIQNYAKSRHSLSPITYIHKYSDTGKKAMLNSENIRESIRSKSDFIEGIKNCIKTALGYKYRLKIDIANCYTSIYTHSVAWAICGKNEAKKYLFTKNPEKLKDTYELADKLDAFIRFQKNNETNGIVVGPFTSRIFSEIILSAIDKQLAKKKYIFRRYVDDYKFYFRSETQAKESIFQIERVLNEFGLHLNTAKTDISCYPFEIISQMKQIYEKALESEGVFGVLNAASHLYTNGEKGAYKYALKFIRDKEPSYEDFGIIMSSLINILLLEPKYGKHVITYIKKHIHKWNQDIVAELINRELSISICDELQQEALIFLQIIRELEVSLSAENLIKIILCSNDFATIIALDIWKNRKKSIKRTKSQATKIKKAIEQLSVELKGEGYSGARWLLLHEIRIHNLMDKKVLPTPSKDEFFEKLHECQVSFYQSVSPKLY